MAELTEKQKMEVAKAEYAKAVNDFNQFPTNGMLQDLREALVKFNTAKRKYRDSLKFIQTELVFRDPDGN